jgi:hypothetical protein
MEIGVSARAAEILAQTRPLFTTGGAAQSPLQDAAVIARKALPQEQQSTRRIYQDETRLQVEIHSILPQGQTAPFATNHSTANPAARLLLPIIQISLLMFTGIYHVTM